MALRKQKNNCIVYFAHSVKDYNTTYEEKCIEEIQRRFPDVIIINPKYITEKFTREEKSKLKGSYDSFMEMMNKHFFTAIQKCDIIYPVVDRDLRKFSQGVLKEIDYAKNNGIKIVEHKPKPSLKNLIKVKTLRKKRNDFYNKSNAMEFIRDYFDVQKGIRCVASHVKNYLYPNYRIWNNTWTMCRPMLFDSTPTLFKKFNCSHTFIYTFKEEIDNWYPKEDKIKMYEDNIVGMNYAIDLDMPDDPEEEKAKRLDFFDSIDQFDDAIETITKRLDDMEEEYQLMFSGNGIYIMFQGYYENDLDEYRQNIINLIDHFKETELGDESMVHICNKGAGWNKFFKLPFMFHETRPRMALPLPKGKIDGEWLDRVSNVDNVLNDYTIVDEIIEKCGWNKLW